MSLRRRPPAYTKHVEKLAAGVPLARWMLYRLLVGDSSDNLPGVPGIGPKAGLKVVERFYSFAALKEGSPDDWKVVLDVRQIAELEKALASGDLERQRKAIELKWLLRLEETPEFIEDLRGRIASPVLNEEFVRSQLIKWEMASFILGWKKFRRAFPALSTE